MTCCNTWASAVVPFLLAQDALMACTALFLMRMAHMSAAESGMLPPRMRQAGTGLLYGAGMFALAAAALKLQQVTAKHLLSAHMLFYLHKQSSSVNPAAQMQHLPVLQKALVAALACTLAPLAEELLFRGWLYGSLQRKFSHKTALLASAALFALAHGSLLHALPLFLMGAVLAQARKAGGTLTTTVTMHALNNALALWCLYH